MTLHATRTEDPNKVAVHFTYGTINVQITEDVNHVRSFWAQLGRLINEDESEQKERVYPGLTVDAEAEALAIEQEQAEREDAERAQDDAEGSQEAYGIEDYRDTAAEEDGDRPQVVETRGTAELPPMRAGGKPVLLDRDEA
jgi:hypothetical protein